MHGTPCVLRGALLAFLADNLASNDLGGFKKSFSFAFRSCRTCFVTKDTLVSSFVSEGFEKRGDATHCKQCEFMQGPMASHYSKAYGINRQSALLNVKYFSWFGGGLPHDAMHDIFEGVSTLGGKILTVKLYFKWPVCFR